jgi:hypothetical protein
MGEMIFVCQEKREHYLLTSRNFYNSLNLQLFSWHSDLCHPHACLPQAGNSGVAYSAEVASATKAGME